MAAIRVRGILIENLIRQKVCIEQDDHSVFLEEKDFKL